MNITWINAASSKSTGAFVTLRSHREASGSVRLNIYFSAKATAALKLKRGERLLIGLDESQQRLAFKCTLFGGNALKGRDLDKSLSVVATLPVLEIPEPQIAGSEDIHLVGDHFEVPFRFEIAEEFGFRQATQLKRAA